MMRMSHLALAVLGVIVSLTLVACSSSSIGGTSESTGLQTPLATNTLAIPTYTPAAPTECGFVHFGPPGLSPANYQELVNCFVTSFQQCHPVHFVYEFFSATDQGHNELSLSGTAQNCLIHVKEHYVSTKTNPPSATDYTYACSRLEQRAGHYVITDCDNHFEINFP
ncbi:MAG TPA: hypothetical protein VH349_05020 [Ktedonobacterales bacterium]